MAKTNSFYNRITRLFRSGPAIQRRVKGYDAKSFYSNQLIKGNYGYRAAAPFGFGRENSPFSVLGSYGILDRMSRYAEFGEMEYSSILSRGLDIYADEVVGGDDRGKCFHVYSDNFKIKKALEDLFYDVLNVEFNLRAWTRNMIKYGDFFLLTEVLPDIGIVNTIPIPVNELEREEGFDPEDPYAVRFKWLTRGNQYLENWQVAHFRILGNDLFLPYGTSVLESARRTYRQLVMLEDAMLTYRIVRSPERRVFYIDVGNMAPNDVPTYMEAAKAALNSRSTMDRENGREDMRFNSPTILDDYYIPVRAGQTNTRVETLSGGQHVTATEDVEYVQKKLFAAIGVPKPYLNYDENLSAKAALSQLDIRFSRSVGTYQKIMLSELNKLAIIHLFSIGFDGMDLVDFEIKLSNPSSIALQQKLELWAAKFDVGGTARETGLVDDHWIQKNILEFSKDEIESIKKGRYSDKIKEMEIELAEPVPEDPNKKSTTTSLFDPSNYDLPAPHVPKNPPKDKDGEVGLSTLRRYDNNGKSYVADLSPGQSPIKATPFLTRNRRNRVRRVGAGGRDNTAMPDISAMVSMKNKYTKDVYGQYTESFNDDKILSIKDQFGDDFKIEQQPKLNKEVVSILNTLKPKLRKTEDKQNKLLSEALNKSLETNEDNSEEEEMVSKILIENAFDNSSHVTETQILIESHDKNDDITIDEKTLSDVFNVES